MLKTPRLATSNPPATSNEPELLFERLYRFIRDVVLEDFAWPDVATAVEARKTQFQGTSSMYGSVLPILTCIAAGGEAAHAIPLAASWVLYDLASDIFDDLQDKDGKNWPWNRWEASRIMNVGLGIVAAAEVCLARIPTGRETHSDIAVSWARTFAFAARGQVIAPGIPSLRQYFDKTLTKSGLIYAQVSRAGARLCTDDAEILAAMYGYGLALGMVIQIRDDCRDLYRPDLLLSDLALGNYTLPVLYALSLDDHPCHNELRTMLTKSEQLGPEDVIKVYRILTDMNAFSYSYALARGYQQKALSALGRFPAGQVSCLAQYVSGFFLS